ncbi:MAG: CHAP domain-containing protein [Eubacterium sp.]|nr:CHAP domain-containing protein [Eubacterium sp.]
MKFSKKVLCTTISFLILLSTLIPFSVQAASESALRNSVVSIARDEVGYTGSSSYSKYGDWYGYQGAWCTTFVLWCFNETGSDNNVKLYGNIIPNGGNCNSMISWFSNKGRYHSRSSGYTPQAGDLVFFDWSGNGSSQHVGIVTGTSGSTVYTVEGNCSGKVKSREYTSSGSKPYNNISSIMGYGAPDFSSVSSGGSSSGGNYDKPTSPPATTKKPSGGNNSNNQNTTKRNSTTSTTATTETTTEQIKLDTLSINASTYDLQIGDTVKLNYSVEPSNISAVVGYFCDEEGIIELDADGDIKAIGAGTATVVVCANNELYKQCDFTVTEAVAEVTTREVSERKVVGTTQQTITTEKNVQSVLTKMGVNVEMLSQNKQFYIIPAAIAGLTFIISIFTAAAGKAKRK